MRQIIIIYFLIIFLIGCNSSCERTQKNSTAKVGLKEKFVIKGFNVGVEIYLKPDFTFINNCYSYGCIGGYRIKLVTGHYEIDSNQIKFKPEKLIWKEDLNNHYFDSKMKFDTLEYYESDSTSIQMKYWLIQERNMKFLVSESKYNEYDELFYKSSNFISLANLYNSGIVQETTENLLSNKDTIWDFRKLDLDKSIPDSYKKYFIDVPVNAEVIGSKVYKINESLIPKYKLDLKENKGVWIGMKLYSQDFPDYPIKIIEINNENIIAQGYNLFYENTKLKLKTIVSTERKAVAKK